MPPPEADDQPPPSTTTPCDIAPIDVHFDLACDIITSDQFAILGRLTDRVLGLLPNTGSVRVRIVDDAEMVLAHARFCDQETTTDVLTFDLASGSTEFNTKVLDTDLIICADEAQRQSRERGHPIAHELLLYILHGVLHCLGYDDHDKREYERMHAREDELLRAAGVGAVFSDSSDEETRS